MSAAASIIGILKQIKDAIGGEPPDEDVLEIVKKALEQKLANKEKPFVDLLHNEFYNWLRTAIGPKPTNSFWQKPISEAKVQSVNGLVNLFLITVRRLPSPVIVNLNQVEAIAAETVSPPVTKFASERNAYATSLELIKRVINEALLNPGVSEEVFTQKKDERSEEFETIAYAKDDSLANGGGAGGSAASGGGGGGGGNARARRRGLKSRRRNRKQRKTRKQK
jgi:hypothetical protein